MNSTNNRIKLIIFALTAAIIFTKGFAIPSRASALGNEQIDTNQWYRLSNSFLGDGRSLDTYSDTHAPFMGETGSYSGQYWKLIPLGDGYYRLSNMFLGDGRSLDTYSDTHAPFMGETGNYSGQYWKLTPLGDGYYRLSNMFLGDGRSLDTYSDTHAPFMGETGNYSGQLWEITPLGPIEDEESSIPPQDEDVPNEPTDVPEDEEEGQPCQSHNSCLDKEPCMDITRLAIEYGLSGSNNFGCISTDVAAIVEELETLDYDVCASMVGGPNAGDIAAFSDMAKELNATVTVGAGSGGSVILGGTNEAGFMIGPAGQAGCYISRCFGFETDVQGSVYENLGIFSDWDNVAGRSVIISEGVSVPFVEAGYATSQVMSSGELIGVVYTFSVGAGVLPVGLSGMSCTTSIVQIRPTPVDNTNNGLPTRQQAEQEVERLEQKIETLRQTLQAERSHNSQSIGNAQAALQTEQDKVNNLSQEIAQMRQTIQAERAQVTADLQTAQNDVNAAQRDVDSLKTEIYNTQAIIDKINRDIAAKKSWLDGKAWFEKVWAGPEYAAFASVKRIEQAGLYSKIAGLEASIKSATLVLNAANQNLYFIEANKDTFPIESDPRMITLYAARDTANLALEAAKSALDGADDISNLPPIDSDPRILELLIELRLAEAELELLY